jgi:membrane protein implicated in regulation of membrane protease activity
LEPGGKHGALELSGVFGVGLMAWITVQWVLLTDRLWLQTLMFLIGAIIVAFSLLAVRRSAPRSKR